MRNIGPASATRHLRRGPRAWRILDARIEGGDGERTEFDKDFYDTALKYQKGHRLPNGSSMLEYQRRAFAFVQHIMPNLAQKFEPEDASEYMLKLMPSESALLAPRDGHT